jgi:hypothetical protein
MPGWQIVLIAGGAAIVAAVVAVLVDRTRAARRRVAAPKVWPFPSSEARNPPSTRP